MKKLLMDLQLFAGGHDVNCLKDANMTTFSASSSSDVQANATVTLTVTPASGYELDYIEVLAGGVEPKFADNAWTFKMGSADVTLIAHSKANNIYKIVENCDVWVNGSKTHLQRNMTLEAGPNGAIVGVTCTGTAVTLSAEIKADLVKAGTLIKI